MGRSVSPDCLDRRRVWLLGFGGHGDVDRKSALHRLPRSVRGFIDFWTRNAPRLSLAKFNSKEQRYELGSDQVGNSSPEG